MTDPNGQASGRPAGSGPSKALTLKDSPYLQEKKHIPWSQMTHFLCSRRYLTSENAIDVQIWKDWIIIYLFLVKPTLLERENLQKVSDFIFLGFKIPVDGDCSCKIKTIAHWKNSYDKPRENIKKQTQITLLTMVCTVKAIVMYGYEKWTIKKAEHRRTDAFKLWCGEYSWEPLGLPGDQKIQSQRKSTLNIH